jgi:hypothetical protein
VTPLAKAIPTPTSVLRCSSDFLPTEPFYQAVNPTSVPEDDGKVILAQTQGIEPNIVSQIVSLKQTAKYLGTSTRANIVYMVGRLV